MPRIPAGQKKTKADQKAMSQPIEQDVPAVVATIEPPQPEPPEPKKVKTPPPPASDLVAEEVHRERRLAECREELFFRRHELLADGNELPPGELRILQGAVVRLPHENDYGYRERFAKFLHREDTRVQRILAMQSAAGSPSDRKAADKLADQTQSKLDAEGPAIEQQIRELQSRLETLRSEAANAKTAADARHEAVTGLQDDSLLPAFLKDNLAVLYREHETDFGGELRELETRRVQIQGLLSLDVNAPAGREVAKLHVGGDPRFGRDNWSRLEALFSCERVNYGCNTGFRVGSLKVDVWNRYLDELAEELATVESRIEAIEAGEQAAAEAAVVELLNHYVPG